MKLRIMGARTLVLCLGCLMINAGSALAASATLSGVTGNSCTPYTSFAVDGSGNLSVICPSGGPAPTTPQCTLTPSLPTLPFGGGPTTLTATCSPAATTYAWTGNDGTDACNIANTINTCTVSPTTSGPHGYTVKGNNGADGNTASATVTVASPPPPPDQGNCTVVPITWTAGLDLRPGLASSTPLQHLPAGKTYAFSMTVPAGLASSSARTSYTVGVNKDMALSTTACSFTGGLSNNFCKNLGNPDAVVRYSPTSKFLYCTMPAAGTTVYFNVRNGLEITGADTCKEGGAGCEFYFSW